MTAGIGGLAGWLIKGWRRKQPIQPHLTLLDRIALAPRQSLALVEAEGRRILVATSADGAPAFFPLSHQDGTAGPMASGPHSARRVTARPARVSW